jgi:hypothetical protein
MATTVAYTAQVNIRHYIVPMLATAIELEDAVTASAGGASLTAWLDVADAISGNLDVTHSYVSNVFTLTVDGTAYPLDGTGAPIRLLNVTGAPINTQTSDESVITHDAATRGSTITVGTSNAHSIAFKGMTVHKSVDHKILTILRQFGISENMAVKYLREGPAGTSEKQLCYGRIASKTEEGDAGALTKYGFTLNALGEVYTIMDND